MDVKQRILSVALVMAVEVGIARITRNPLAKRAGVGYGVVSYHFGTMEFLRECVVGEAVRTENIAVLAKALGEGHFIAREAPEELKARAIATLM